MIPSPLTLALALALAPRQHWCKGVARRLSDWRIYCATSETPGMARPFSRSCLVRLLMGGWLFLGRGSLAPLPSPLRREILDVHIPSCARIYCTGRRRARFDRRCASAYIPSPDPVCLSPTAQQYLDPKLRPPPISDHFSVAIFRRAALGLLLVSRGLNGSRPDLTARSPGASESKLCFEKKRLACDHRPLDR